MALYSGYYFTIDEFPAAGQTHGQIDMVDERLFIADDNGSGTRHEVGDVIDGSAIVEMSRLYEDQPQYPGQYEYTTGSFVPSGDIQFEMGDGTIISTADNNTVNNSYIMVQFFKLADGRALLSLGHSDNGAWSMIDELKANGSGLKSITPSANYTFLSGATGNTSKMHYRAGEVGLASAPCFTAGTLIETDKGPVLVELLQEGDKVRTKDHGFQPVRWVGCSRTVAAPIRIAKGVFGNARDLVVSPRHRMLVQGWQVDLMFNHEEVFATAGHLKNGTTITQEPEGWVEYFHVLLDRHEVIYAEGAETESFFPDEASVGGMAKSTRAELEAAVDLSTFGRTVRPTLTANQAMYLSHNMDLLEDAPDQIAAQ